MSRALALILPPELIDEIADAVCKRLDADGLLGRSTPVYLTTTEAAEYIRASRQRVFDLTSSGRLPVHKDGSRNLYRRDDLDAYLSRGDA